MFDLPGRLRRSRTSARRSPDDRGRDSLKARVEALEEEMQETRRLNRRLAELMDVVEELLVPLSQQDHERVEAYLASNTVRLDAGRFEGGQVEGGQVEGGRVEGGQRDDRPERG